MLPHLSERELAFLRFLANSFAIGKVSYSCDIKDFWFEGKLIVAGEAEALIRTMQGCDAVEITSRGINGSIILAIKHEATQMVREMNFHADLERRETERREADRKSRQEDKEADRLWQAEQKKTDRRWQFYFSILSAVFSLITAAIGYYLGINRFR